MSGPSSIVKWSHANRDIIAKAGLDEKETRDLFAELLRTNKDDNFVRSAESYFGALRNYCSSSYQALTSRFPGEISLEQAYVPLSGKGHDGKSEVLLLSDAIRAAFELNNKRILVEGGPGSGKSTLLRQIARHAWAQPGAVGLDRPYIVLPLRLRSYAEVTGASSEDRIWRALDSARQLEVDGPRPPAGYFEAWPELIGAPWLFLLDGFDEVPSERRQEVISWLRRLISGDSALIITSRPTDVLTLEFRQPLTQFDVQPFSSDQQSQLATKWLGERAETFLRAFAQYSKGELGGTPLLLTISAIVYYQSGELPLRRSELYSQFVADTWQEARSRGAIEDLSPELFELGLICLQRVARRMTEGRDEGSALDFGSDPQALAISIAELLSAELNLSKTIANLRAEKVLKVLTEHSSVLRMNSNQLEWLHPTFREFLAARDLSLSTEAELHDLFDNCGDVTWRQVILFLIAIRSERGSVEPLLEYLKALNPPWGLELTGVAIAEGANVEHAFVEQVIQEICRAISALAQYGYCERLLSVDSTKTERLLAVLKPFADAIEMRPYIVNLCADLERNAIEYGGGDASGIEDLKELGARDVLVRIAANPRAGIPVRASAGRALFDLGCLGEGNAAFLDLAAWASLEPGRWTDLVRALAMAPDADLFALLAEKGLASDGHWSSLLDAVSEDDKSQLLTRLATDHRLSASQRSVVQIRTITDAKQALEVLLTAACQPVIARACVDILIRVSDQDALVHALLASESSPLVRLLALRALGVLKAYDQLKKIFVSVETPYSLRRRSAEILYESPLNAETASLLLRFFDGLGTSRRPLNLQRRGFLRYFLDKDEEALEIFSELFTRRSKTSWVMGVYAHCLQRLGRTEEALAAYGEALELQPSNTFARCQRAFLYWLRDDIADAMADVEHTRHYGAPTWFRPFAGEILRRSERLDEAQEWFDAIVKDNSNQLRLALTLRSNLAFHRGLMSEAIADYRSLQGIDAVPDPGTLDVTALENLAKSLRAAGCFAEAVVEYSSLINRWFDSGGYTSGRAEALLRLEAFEEADRDIASLRSQLPDEPFAIYLEGLSRSLQGDREALRRAAVMALAMPDAMPDNNAGGTEYVNAVISNRALYCFAIDDADQAQSMLGRLVSDRALDQLRYYTLPYLDTLTHALPNRDDIVAAMQTIKTFAWPDGWQVDAASSRRAAALKDIRRESYAFPIYCQLFAIGGLYGDKDLGERIFSASRFEGPSVALWTLGQPDRLYGHCNFKKASYANYNLKFCDHTKEVLTRNLKVLVQQFKVGNLLFMEEELLARFDLTVKAARLPVKCSMIEL
ncbi:MAG: NACHT domain-containing protein [Mesorhizobium sp.]|uniref:NACHT domain-containing protein n=1 Tax=Mesorhizobium sp. TaxID=1871066 RepID=UPI00120029A4|nr:NACHT domain-containing protein [Mesorhizobium sp.]TIS53841.1 MAG: NACHT domain-containing protein [Mesorhizobium sp.]